MIEIKLSQGAKPGHGGILPAAKVTAEIAATRGVPMGEDCISPARHRAFSTPLRADALHRRASPAFERQAGRASSSASASPGSSWRMVKAMRETGIMPDFIVVDGAEGGTGAAPLEFADHRRHADARGPALRPQHARRREPARARSRSAPRARSSARFDIARDHGAGRRLDQRRRAASCSRSAASSR